MGRIREILTVSDTARLPLLRSPLHERIGRIYNALSPAFEASTPSVDDASPHRFTNKRIVFSGSPTENKGAHRLLAMWSHVREADPSAVLQLAGTGRLYGDSRPIGPYGISPPEFESKHIAPLVAKFGSLDAAGIEPLGLLTPNELRQVYEGSTLGIVNLNWRNYTETFCCAAVEMLAAGLPVFSVARGALPEVIGSSSGAYLSKTESVEREAKELLMLLSNSRRLAEMGAAGLTYARREYGWARIIRQWEDVLASASDIEAVSGEWRGPVGLRYWLERGSGRLGMGRLLERMPKHRFSGPTQ
jgi:glycosyltransferase involved in cell wall biosynthesis